MKTKLSSGVKMYALKRGLIAGMISLIIYLLVVIITTPNLPPLTALNAAIKINWIIIFSLAVTIGSQVYISTYAKSIGCKTANKRKGIFGSSSSTAIGSFFSFFSLVPLGCCGSWLLILSLLPSVFGGAFSVILIQYSKALSYFGLIIGIVCVTITIIKLKIELKNRKIVETAQKYNEGEYI